MSKTWAGGRGQGDGGGGGAGSLLSRTVRAQVGSGAGASVNGKVMELPLLQPGPCKTVPSALGLGIWAEIKLHEGRAEVCRAAEPTCSCIYPAEGPAGRAGGGLLRANQPPASST